MNQSSLIGHILELLKATDCVKHPADRTVAEFFRSRKYLGSHDRRIISEILYGIIRHRRYIETILEFYVRKEPGSSDLDHSGHRYLSLLAIYLHVNNDPLTVPTSYWKTYFPNIEYDGLAAYADEFKKSGFSFDDKAVELGVEFSFQDWMVREWIGALGDETELLLRQLNRSPGITLRVNTLKTSREECRERLMNEGIAAEPTRFSPCGLNPEKRFNAQSSPAFNDGWFEIQDEGSQMISILSAPRPGNLIIDACAGAGGKTLHLAALMENKGTIIALDREAKRLRELATRAGRAGVTNLRISTDNSTDIEKYSGCADIVLVDAPCSGSGTIRRNPALKWSITESMVEHFSKLQLAILAENSKFVKTGGKLVYATCSLFREENDHLAGQFLKSHAGFQIDRSARKSGFDHASLATNPTTIYPQIFNTDGFFIAVMCRIA